MSAAAITLIGLALLPLVGGTVDITPVALPAGFGRVHWLLLLGGAGLNTFWFVRGGHAASYLIPVSAGAPAVRKAGVMAALLVGLSAVAMASVGGASDGVGREGLRLADGIVAAAVLALAMASLSGNVMGASALLTVDIARMFIRRTQPRAIVLTGRLVASVALILAILAMSFVSLLSAVGAFVLLRLMFVFLAPVGASAVLGGLIQRGWGVRMVVAAAAGAAGAACALWMRPWGGTDADDILLASVTGILIVAAVMFVPVRSGRTVLGAQGFAGAQK